MFFHVMVFVEDSISIRPSVRPAMVSKTKILRFDGEEFHPAESTTFSHRSVLGMGNYKNSALTVGCRTSNTNTCNDTVAYIKTEIMNMETGHWSNGPDFPFAS